jgi:hypothetical protein
MSEIQLEAPGKGLPFFDSLMMRFFVGPFLSKRTSVEKNWENFDSMNKKIIHKVKDFSLDQMHKKVLVPKLKAIEDSSRHWSLAETLEHIELVGDSISMAIEMLCKGEVPPVIANVADYKPKGKYAGVDPRPAFEAFNQRVRDKLKNLNITLNPPTYKHPWLGDISAQQWQWLLASHSGVHYNQIKHIIKGL